MKDLKTYSVILLSHTTQLLQPMMARNFIIHHIDEGPKDGPILLAVHGQPVWSYLYSRMIPFLNSAGIRVIAPDLPGYGKSTNLPQEKITVIRGKWIGWDNG